MNKKTTNCIEKCPFDKCIWKGKYDDKYSKEQIKKCWIKYFYNKIKEK